MSHKSFRLLILGSALVVLLFAALPAQAQFSSLQGKVTDPAGAVVPGVTVSLTNVTGTVKTAITDDVGAYRFLQLTPGTYSVKAELKGFKTALREGIQLLVDTPTVMDLKLEVGELSQTVTVEAGATKLNTTDAAMGSAIEGLRIRQLPLESRNVAALLSLQPAVTQDGYVAGARSDQSNLTLDGIDVNEQQTGEAFNTVLRVTPDSVQEFKVTTNTASALQGRSSGGQVSLITRTGTNEFHGSLYWFNRNDYFTANDFFNNRTFKDPNDKSKGTLDRPRLNRNLYGGSVGGPIRKGRAFFFYNYEGRQDAKSTPVGPYTVPLASLGQGIAKYNNTAGGITTLTTADMNKLFPVGINSAAVAAMADAARRYPANDTGVGDGLNISGYRFNAPLPLKYNAHTASINTNLTSDGRHTLLFRGNYQSDHENRTPQWPDTPRPSFWNHPVGMAIQHGWTMNPKLVNTLRVGLTRQSFSNQGDSGDNSISFRFVFTPKAYSRTLSRTTPTWNITDDLAWVKGNHTLQFGTNIRLIRNNRISYANAFDSAITNPSFYESSGAVLTNPITNISGSRANLQGALAAIIGRYSQYSGNFNFGADLSVQAQGAGVNRTFGTEEYEFYGQDTWRVSNALTLTLGLRWGVSTPVYEANGLQVKPSVSLGGYFDQRVASAKTGVPYNVPFSVDLAGPVHNKPGFYETDYNNFAPRIAFAWQPSFENSLLKTIFGQGGKTVFRGGFNMAYDRIGSALAVTFDLNNTLGFSSSQTISANTYNVADKPAPLFTGYGQQIRNLPGITIPQSLKFPLQTPADQAQRIESTLDDTLTTPAHYSWNFSVGRELRGGLTVEAAYMGRFARNLLATRDVMALNNLVDPKSGTDWYTAANQLYNLRWANVPVSQVKPIPYFENMFPNFTATGLTPTQRVYRYVALESAEGWDYGPDWTYLQLLIDDRGTVPNYFFHPQYAALSTWSTVAWSDYHAGTLTVRERFKDRLNVDFNYTFSKSIDIGSGLERGGTYGAAFITNSLRPDDNKGLSDFDMAHIINANALLDLPIGRGHALLGGISPTADAILGGWQLSSIFRWNSGAPVGAPFDSEIWATNWNVQSWGVRLRDVQPAPSKKGAAPQYFADPKYAYQSFRNARPGETGDRNIWRAPAYVALDLGLGKSFKMPFEGHALQFRMEVFNATNTQRLGVPTRSRAGMGLNVDPHIGSPAADFGKINSIQGAPRVVQFGLRYDF